MRALAPPAHPVTTPRPTTWSGRYAGPVTTSKHKAFTFPFFRELEPAELSEVSPTAQDFQTGTFTYSGDGEVEGSLVPIDVTIPPAPTPSSTSGCEPGDFPGAPSGPAVALIQRGTCTFGEKVDNAAAAGYDAVIIFNEGQAGRTDYGRHSRGAEGHPSCRRQLRRWRGTVQRHPGWGRNSASRHVTENDPDRETVNVIADSPEGKIKGQTIVVGAHLDSVTGTGDQ